MESLILPPNPKPSAHLANVLPASTAAVLRSSPYPDDDDDEVGDGPYFDLEFSIPDEEEDDEDENENENENESDSASESDENEDASLRSDDPSLFLSQSEDDLFFKGHFSLLFTPTSKPQIPSSLLKPATKLRIFMLKFKKPKPTHHYEPLDTSPKKQHHSKFLVKFKVEEVPIVSLFTRDHNSSRCSNNSSLRSAMQSPVSTTAAASDEKKNPKHVIHKYLNKIKPLYVRASKRYGDKLRFSGQLTVGDSVTKRLRKSRSASSAVAGVRSRPRRMDDSLTQHEDGIQSAIAHCKQSFNATKGSELSFARSRSDPGGERCD